MGRLTNIQEIRKIITDTISSPDGGGYLDKNLKETFIQSIDQNRFIVILAGWTGGKNVYAVIQDVEIKDGFILIHQDNTEDDLAEDFEDAGIPAEAIVKTYISPEERKNEAHTNY